MVGSDENPFRVGCIEALGYRAPDFSWEGFLGRLAALGYWGAVVGPHGSGKTTLLLEAQGRLASRGVRVAFRLLNDLVPGKRRQVLRWVEALPGDTVLFLDGAEQLDFVTWRLLCWRARRLRGLVVTVHRPGRLPTVYETGTGTALLRGLLEELVPGEAAFWWPRAQGHYARCGGNVREVFLALYDDCARGVV